MCLNYESIPWLVSEYPDGVPGRNVLIADEVDKLKAVTSKRWKALCGVKPAHPGWIARAGIVWRGGMTGTPRPNHYSDLYGQVVVADSRERLVVEIDGVLSRSFYDWRAVHFDTNPYQAYAFTLRPGHAEGIEQQIAPITHRLAAGPALKCRTSAPYRPGASRSRQPCARFTRSLKANTWCCSRRSWTGS